MSYGADVPSIYRQLGSCAGRVLKGESPANVRVEQPTTFFVISLKTAKVLDLSIPPRVFAIADQVTMKLVTSAPGKLPTPTFAPLRT
jgi:putative tryptophan/tyrosine transport system substrate-binding protein